jgi:hypothetical protein
MFAVVGGCPGVARGFVDLDLRAPNNDGFSAQCGSGVQEGALRGRV